MADDVGSKEYWEERVAHWGNDLRSLIWIDNRVGENDLRIRRLLGGLVRYNDRVLDVCCGFGRFAAKVISCGAKWDGFDFCEGMKRHWETKVGVGNFWLDDAKKPAFILREPYDLILQVGALQMLDWTHEQFRDNYRRFLKPSGMIVSCQEDFHVFNFYG